MRAEPVFGQVEQRHGQPVASSFTQPARREPNLRNGDLSIGAPDEPRDEPANPRQPAPSWTHGIRVQMTSEVTLIIVVIVVVGVGLLR
jgi:hypothetical protein